MSEYIKREDVLEILGVYSEALIDKAGKPVFMCMAYDIRSLPAEDVVEVVRCKDCKHWTKFPNLQQDGRCHHFDLFVEDTFYCADGERRSE